MLSACPVQDGISSFDIFQVLLRKNAQNETFTKFQNFVKESLSSLIEVGKIQEATREVNAIVSVLNFYAQQNGTAGKEERQQVSICKSHLLFCFFKLRASWSKQYLKP